MPLLPKAVQSALMCAVLRIKAKERKKMEEKNIIVYFHFMMFMFQKDCGGITDNGSRPMFYSIVLWIGRNGDDTSKGKCVSHLMESCLKFIHFLDNWRLQLIRFLVITDCLINLDCSAWMIGENWNFVCQLELIFSLELLAGEFVIFTVDLNGEIGIIMLIRELI